MFGLRKVNRNTHTFETTFQNWKENGEDVALLMPEFSAKWLPLIGEWLSLSSSPLNLKHPELKYNRLHVGKVFDGVLNPAQPLIRI